MFIKYQEPYLKMMEADTFEPHKKSINKIETVIDDPLLSQFKYHFIIQKLPIFHIIYDKLAWDNFIVNIYKGFNAKFIGHNSIHIVQLLNIMPQLKICDLIVGFRRDQHAINIYKEFFFFEFKDQKYDIQVAEGFKTYLDELNEKCRQQAAQREKIRAEQNQQFQRNSEPQQKPKSSPIFIRQASNPISVYQSKSQNQISDMCPEQGEIIDTPRKNSVRRKNSSEEQSSSASSRSSNTSKQKKYKRNSKDSSSSESRSNRYSRNRNSMNEKSYRKQSSSRSSRSSSRKSSRSGSSSESSRERGSYHRNNDRNDRSRDKRPYKRDSSSQYSSNSSYHKNEGERRRNYSRTGDDRRRGRDDKGQKYQDHKYEQNRKYEIYPTPSYNRTYSSNYNENRIRQGVPQLTKKLSYEAYNAYRGQAGRYEGQHYDYQKPNSSSSSYNYYKNVAGYPFPKPSQFDKKEPYSQSNNDAKPPNNNQSSQYNRYGSNNNSKSYY